MKNAVGRIKACSVEFDNLLLVVRLPCVILSMKIQGGTTMLANQIIFLRKKAGMSQLQLAEKLNVGPSAVGMYEQGRRTPAVEVLIEMASIFRVSLDYLITGKEYIPIILERKIAGTQCVCPCQICKCRGKSIVKCI